MFDPSKIRSIQALRSTAGYNLTPVFEGQSMPTLVPVSEFEYSQVQGNLDGMKNLAALKLNGKTTFVVIDENLLGYVKPQQPFRAGILAANVIGGANHFPVDGPKPIPQDSSRVRAACASDFRRFRCNPDPYLNDSDCQLSPE